MEFDLKENSRRRMKLECKRMLYVIGFLGLLCAGVVARQAYQYFALRGDLQDAGDRVEVLRQKKDKLQEEKEALGKLEYVEKVARDQYNMVKPNEIPVFIAEEKSADKADK